MNILVTGANGFIGSNVAAFLECNTKYNIFKLTRSVVNLHSLKDLNKYIIGNKINAIIHCAIEGGKRCIKDDISILHNNILMIQNLLSCQINGPFINIASGAEFDRKLDIFEVHEKEIYNRVPTDYYGLSKNVISKLVNNIANGINLRLFGCFNYNENCLRMIKSNLNNYILKKPIIIHEDKYMDFIYSDDLCNLIVNIIQSPQKLYDLKDINIVYNKKYKLSDIANIITSIDNYKVPILINNPIDGLNYCGNGQKFNNLNLNNKGLEAGIVKCYLKSK